MRSITFLLATVLLEVLNCCSLTAAQASARNGPLHGRCFFIKNVYTKEYLYTNADRKISSVHKDSKVPVFTWRKLTDGPASEWSSTFGEKHRYQGVWLFETKGCTDCYTIKTVYFDNPESLYSVASADPEFQKRRPNRPVYAYHVDHAFPEEEGEEIWKIENVPNGRVGQIRIYSKHIGSATGEPFFASSDDEAFDKDRRNVFTWSSKDDSIAFDQRGEWFLEKATCPPHILV